MGGDSDGTDAIVSRYTEVSSLAAGGGGTVSRVRDQHLGRDIAMKTQHWGARERRFVREARVLARLQHPTIVSLFDAGVLPDGRRWFTMPEVRGRTLTELIDAVHACSHGRWGVTPDGWSLPRLVGVIEEVARAIAYAHASGVVHRDLHPGNIMVGAFGQVQIVDWGIALELDDNMDQDGIDDVLESIEGTTSHGTRLGTPAYMSPEQATGDISAHGPHTDVYGLGALLDTAITGGPPYPATARAWRRVLRGPPAPLADRLRADHPTVSPELAEIASTAMARSPAKRPSASELAASLRGWLDGTSARNRAFALLTQADASLQRLRDTQGRAADLRATADAHLATLPPSASLAEKREAWGRQSEARVLDVEAARIEAEALGQLHQALAEAPDLDGAHRRLAAYYRREAETAEQRADAPALARLEALIHRHDRGENAAWLAGEGRLQLHSAPDGLEVVARRYSERDLRLQPGEAISLGRTPLEDLPLSRGSWEIELRDGDRAVRFPARIERMQTWSHIRPGETQPHRFRIPTVEAGVCAIPGGWFLSGGDPEAVGAGPRRRLWVEAFAIRRDPVTVREYLDFLDSVHGSGGETQALLPSWRPSAQAKPVALAARDAGGRHRIVELEGMPTWSETSPVVFVTWHAAMAYARWRADLDGVAWRLPHDMEWEKAARGTDARRYPWGDAFDPAFCWMKESAVQVNAHQEVGGAPLDVSPYGVRGLAGNVRDWCLNAFEPTPPAEGSRIIVPQDMPDDGDTYRMCRGGSWTNSSLGCLVAQRLAAKPGHAAVNVGFRLARSL